MKDLASYNSGCAEKKKMNFSFMIMFTMVGTFVVFKGHYGPWLVKVQLFEIQAVESSSG